MFYTYNLTYLCLTIQGVPTTHIVLLIPHEEAKGFFISYAAIVTDRGEMMEWCREQGMAVEAYPYSDRFAIRFESKSDAMLFKLSYQGTAK